MAGLAYQSCGETARSQRFSAKHGDDFFLVLVGRGSQNQQQAILTTESAVFRIPQA